MIEQILFTFTLCIVIINGIHVTSLLFGKALSWPGVVGIKPTDRFLLYPSLFYQVYCLVY
jgi:hypothetical protein